MYLYFYLISLYIVTTTPNLATSMPSPASCNPCWLITFCSHSLPTLAISIHYIYIYIYVCVCVSHPEDLNLQDGLWFYSVPSNRHWFGTLRKAVTTYTFCFLHGWYFPLYSAVQQIIKALYDVCSFHSMPDGYSRTVIAASPFAGVCPRSAGPNWVRSYTNLNATEDQPKFTFCSPLYNR